MAYKFDFVRYDLKAEQMSIAQALGFLEKNSNVETPSTRLFTIDDFFSAIVNINKGITESSVPALEQFHEVRTLLPAWIVYEGKDSESSKEPSNAYSSTGTYSLLGDGKIKEKGEVFASAGIEEVIEILPEEDAFFGDIMAVPEYITMRSRNKLYDGGVEAGKTGPGRIATNFLTNLDTPRAEALMWLSGTSNHYFGPMVAIPNQELGIELVHYMDAREHLGDSLRETKINLITKE